MKLCNAFLQFTSALSRVCHGHHSTSRLCPLQFQACVKRVILRGDDDDDLLEEVNVQTVFPEDGSGLASEIKEPTAAEVFAVRRMQQAVSAFPISS